jgi:hypothetical protein
LKVPLALTALLLLAAPKGAFLHTPPAQARANEPLLVDGSLAAEEPYDEVVLLYRGPGQEYVSTQMTLQYGDLYRGVIPGDRMQAPGVEYYVEGRSKLRDRTPIFMSARKPARVLVLGPDGVAPKKGEGFDEPERAQTKKSRDEPDPFADAPGAEAFGRKKKKEAEDPFSDAPGARKKEEPPPPDVPRKKTEPDEPTADAPRKKREVQPDPYAEAPAKKKDPDPPAAEAPNRKKDAGEPAAGEPAQKKSAEPAVADPPKKKDGAEIEPFPDDGPPPRGKKVTAEKKVEPAEKKDAGDPKKELAAADTHEGAEKKKPEAAGRLELDRVGGESGLMVPAPRDWSVTIRAPAGEAPKMLASLERICTGKGDIGTVYVQVGEAGQSPKQLLEKLGSGGKKTPKVDAKTGWLCVDWSDHEAACGGTLKSGPPAVSVYLAAADRETFEAAGGMRLIRAIASGLTLNAKGFAQVKKFQRAGAESCP